MTHATGPEETRRAADQGSLQSVQPTEMTAWVGWIAFASAMMVLLGTFHVIQGLVAIFRDEYYLVTKNGLTLHVDYTTWGWVHILGGALIVAAGLGLLVGQMWARIVGVLFALASAILNVAFLSAYPVWSGLMVVLDILVIWALTVHGSEMKKSA